MTVYGTGLRQEWESNKYSPNEIINLDNETSKDIILRRTIDAYNRTLDIQPENIQTCLEAQLEVLSGKFPGLSRKTFLDLTELVNKDPGMDSRYLLYLKMVIERKSMESENSK